MLFNIATALSIGFMIGVELAVSVFINPIVWKLDDRTQLQMMRLFAARLGAAMPFWYALNLVFLVAQTVVRRNRPGFPLLLTASSIWAAVIVFTLLFLVPINNRLAHLDIASASPEQSLREHRKWDTLHRLRIAALTAGFIIFLLASWR